MAGENRSIETFSNHFHRFLTVIITGLCVWMVTTINENQLKQNTVGQKIVALTEKIDGLTVDRYYGRDAARDFQLRDAALSNLTDLYKLMKDEMKDLKVRVRDLERAIDKKGTNR